MLNLLQKINEDNFNMVAQTPYIFKNHYVPRVTSILSDMLNEEYLMGWSNYLGFKRQKYKDVLNSAAEKGSYVHNSIEAYIQSNIEPNIGGIPFEYQTAVRNAYESFRLWWSIIMKNDTKVIFQEQVLVCEWFGGTLDILLSINGKYYLFDFKTSNHPSYKYFLQLSAYRYILRKNMEIELDGCGIIVLDKNAIHFDEIMIDFTDEFDRDFMEHCQETFLSLVYSYYNRLRVEQEFKQILKRVS